MYFCVVQGGCIRANILPPFIAHNCTLRPVSSPVEDRAPKSPSLKSTTVEQLIAADDSFAKKESSKPVAVSGDGELSMMRNGDKKQKTDESKYYRSWRATDSSPSKRAVRVSPVQEENPMAGHLEPTSHSSTEKYLMNDRPAGGRTDTKNKPSIKPIDHCHGDSDTNGAMAKSSKSDRNMDDDWGVLTHKFNFVSSYDHRRIARLGNVDEVTTQHGGDTDGKTVDFIFSTGRYMP